MKKISTYICISFHELLRKLCFANRKAGCFKRYRNTIAETVFKYLVKDIGIANLLTGSLVLYLEIYLRYVNVQLR